MTNTTVATPKNEEPIAPPPPALLVIFGGGGDLTWRKLMPALYNLYLDGWMPKEFTILGVDRRDFTADEYRQHLRDGIDRFSRQGTAKDGQWQSFAQRVQYSAADVTKDDVYTQIGEQLGGTLGAGHHIDGLGGESQFPQVRGNVFRRAGGVVGDEQGAGVGGFQRRDRPFGWSMAPEQGAVQVEQ